MKKVIVKQGEIALVFKNGELKKVLKAGKHWIWFHEKIEKHKLDDEFYPAEDFYILLENPLLRDELEIVKVLNNEIVLMYNKGIFEGILETGIHPFWKSEFNDFYFQKMDISKTEPITEIDKNMLQDIAFSYFTQTFVVENYEKGILFVDGKKEAVLSSGIYYFWKNASRIKVEKVDMRQIQLEISGQELLTQDKIALRINFFITYKVTDAQKALMENRNFEKQLYVLTQLALREYTGAYNLDELLENKENLTQKVLQVSQTKADTLGVKILDAGIKDIILSGDIKEIMNRVIIAQKQAQANVITRREETASTRSLLNTAKLMEQNQMLFKLKEMEFVEKIADKIGEVSLNGQSNIAEQLKTIFSK